VFKVSWLYSEHVDPLHPLSMIPFWQNSSSLFLWLSAFAGIWVIVERRGDFK